MIIEGGESKRKKFSNNPGYNILELYKVLVQIRFETSKTEQKW